MLLDYWVIRVYIHLVSEKIDKKELIPCADCLCFNVRKASRIVTQIYDDLMSDTGLRGTQFTIVVMIAVNESITISKLAEALVMDRTTLTRNLKPLQKQGLVEIIPGVDRRTRSVKLTSLGIRTLKQALPLWRTAQKRASERFGKVRLENLLSELRAINEIAD